MRVIGTAGHIDHGKSALVKALTGIDPDRLKEEKQRQMTIDLGFAWFNLSDGEPVGVVDVPGHRDFIENMLAGVGGMDAVLLVVAADEGVMPQTREHLAIIDLLKIPAGIVVVTKIDLVKDLDWLALVQGEISQTMSGTVLECAPIISVSARTGEGIQDLKQTLASILGKCEPRSDSRKPRLPIDRVFTVAGFGTVVTGTLSGGSLEVGESVEILPAAIKARIRGLQVYKNRVDMALPGSRTAVNLSGVDQSQIKRGNVVSRAGIFTPTRRFDANIETLPEALTELRHDDRVKVFLNTYENVGRIRLLGENGIHPGGKGWVQIEMEAEAVADMGDRFIIRRMSPPETIGGGLIVNPHPRGRYKRNDQAILKRLETRIQPSSEELVLNHLDESGIIEKVALKKNASTVENFEEALSRLCVQKKVMILGSDAMESQLLLSTSNWLLLTEKMRKFVSKFHTEFPLKPGLKAEDMAAIMRISPKVLGKLLKEWIDNGNLMESNGFFNLPEHIVRFSPAQIKKIEDLHRLIDEDPFNPPTVNHVKEILGDSLMQALLDQGMFVRVSPEILFRKEEYLMMWEYVQDSCGAGNIMTVAQFRDHFQSSRRYSLAFLEYLDRKNLTIREGDGRKLKPVDRG